ncbi:MAG TPA: YceI family protein [Candidatus Obscuribacterales bacterium]
MVDVRSMKVDCSGFGFISASAGSEYPLAVASARKFLLAHCVKFAAAVALLLSSVNAGLAKDWTIDPAHSSAEFSIRHMMVSNVRGGFSNIKGEINYDEKDLNKTHVRATIDVSTINTKEPARDEHLRSPEFFDVSKFPTMTFESKKAIAKGPRKFQLEGDLTLHGVSKLVTLDVETSPEIKDMKGNERIGATATGKINRKDFGITYNKILDGGGVALGEEIPIVLEIEASKPKL